MTTGACQPSAPAGTSRSWLDAILVYRDRRIASMLALGFSAGLPFLLVYGTLSAWLRQSHIERATIGMLGWVGLSYTLKFLWAPFVDRARLPVLHRALGRRRSWMLLAQVGIVFGLFNLGLCDPAQNVLRVAGWALFVAFCSATQDISLDAWRIESAPPEMQGGMAAAYQLGYRIALTAASAGALWMAADFGWSQAYAAMAALGGVGILTTLLVHEPASSIAASAAQPAQGAVAQTVVQSIVGPVTDFFRRFGLGLGLLVFAFISTYRLTEFAMGSMANPFYIDSGFTLKQVAAVAKVYGLLMSIVGIVVGGIAVARLGRLGSLVLGSVLVMISNLAFAAFAAAGSTSVVGLATVISLDNLALGVHGTALIAFLSSLTSSGYTATQYAVLSSLYALPGKLILGTSGFVVDAIGYTRFFVYTASLSLPGLLLLYLLARRGLIQRAERAPVAPTGAV